MIKITKKYREEEKKEKIKENLLHDIKFKKKS